jgi:hypothetical protein
MAGLHGDHGLQKCKTPLFKSGVCKSTWSKKGDRFMIILMLFVLLVLLRKRRTKRKIEIDLSGARAKPFKV